MINRELIKKVAEATDDRQMMLSTILDVADLERSLIMSCYYDKIEAEDLAEAIAKVLADVEVINEIYNIHNEVNHDKEIIFNSLVIARTKSKAEILAEKIEKNTQEFRKLLKELSEENG